MVNAHQHPWITSSKSAAAMRAKASSFHHLVGACRRARVVHRLCVQPANLTAGMPPAPQPPTVPSPPRKPITTTSSPSLPIMLVGLSGGVLAGAAALHFGGNADHASIASAASTAVDTIREFGPADIISQTFGPARPLWSALVHSHQVASAAHAPASAAPADLHLGNVREVVGNTNSAVRVAVDNICNDYNSWLEESPLVCKIVTGNFFTVAGDMLAQLGLGGGGGHGGEAASCRRGKVDLWRTGRLCLETSAIGTPMGHWWFNLLDSHIMPDNPHCPAAVLTKMLTDQILFAPFGLLLFFVVIKCLEGRPRDVPEMLKKSYMKTLLGGYMLWPLAGILNFALLPNEYRLLFNNCINILWTCFLSIMSTDGAAASPNGAQATSGCTGAAVTKSFHATSVCKDIASAVEMAVLMPALSAAASGTPHCPYVVAIAAANVKLALHACSHEQEDSMTVVDEQLLQQQPQNNAQRFSSSFAPGSSVGGPCLEPCEQPVDALYETR